MRNFTQLALFAGAMCVGTAAQAATLGTDYYPDPDPEETLTEFPSEIYITFSQGVKLNSEDDNFATISGPDNYMEYCYMEAAGDCLMLEVEVPGETNGEYTVNIADGKLSYEDGTEVGAISFTYNLETEQTGGQEVDFTVSPDPAETQAKLEGKVEITFAKADLPEGVYWFEGTPMVTVEGIDNTFSQTYELKSDWNNEYLVYFTVNPAITEKGKYLVKVDGSKILNASNDRPLADFAFTYSVGGGSEEPATEVNFAVTPDPAVEQATLFGRVDITFDKADYKDGVYWMQDEAPDVTIEGVGNTFTQTTKLEYGTNDWSAYFNVDPAITEAGQYKVTVQGSKVLDAGTDKGIGDFSFTYTLTGGSVAPSELAVTIDPAEGVVTELQYFTVTFEGATTVMVNTEASPKEYPYLAKEEADGTLTKTQQCYKMPGSEVNNTLEFYLGQPVNTPGKYAIVIPTTFAKIDGEYPEEEYVFHYTIEGATLEYGYELNPEPGEVTELKEITLTFTGVKSIERDGTMFPGPSLQLVDAEGNVKSGVGMTAASEGDTAIKFTLPYGIDEDGIYRLTIPANYVTMTGENGETAKNDKIEALYYYNVPLAISGISADGGNAAYYDLTGRRVAQPQNGVYVKVQNGKAVKVVR